MWANLTRAQVNNQVATVFDTRVVSAPQIKDEITGPLMIPALGSEPGRATTLADLLNSAPLPVRLGVTGYATHH